MKETTMNYVEFSDKLEVFFTTDGSCPKLGDPFRDKNEIYDLIFDEDGNVRYEARKWLLGFIASNPVSPLSTAVRIIMADDFASNTKGNYSAIYMWR